MIYIKFDTNKKGVLLQKLALYMGWRWGPNHIFCIKKNIPNKYIIFDNKYQMTMFYSSSKSYNETFDFNFYEINYFIVKLLLVPEERKVFKNLIISRNKQFNNYLKKVHE